MRVNGFLTIALIIVGLSGCVSGAKPGTKEALVPMVYVQGGSFIMGNEAGKAPEKPEHSVTIADFMIGAREITQQEWLSVMGSSPAAASGAGPDYPVYNVSWSDAVKFCNALSEKEGLAPCYSGTDTSPACDFTASGYRLPTEAEWEYAARAGSSTEYAGSDDAAAVAWTTDNSENIAHPVASLTPNAFGLFDMSGNVWEWCWDWFDASYYAVSPSDNPKGPESGMYRVLRGGSRGGVASTVRVTNRYFGAHRSDASTGFRVARSVKAK